jgi:acetyl esterase/lipase
VIAVFPGGGYDHLAEHEGDSVARWLAGIGIAAAVVRYRVRPYFLPSALQDARRAIRLLRARAGEWTLDAGRLGAMGFSAGGHLAACISTIDDAEPGPDDLAEFSARPDAMVGCYAPVSLTAMGRKGPHEWLLGANPSQQLQRYVELDRHVTPANPPAFLWSTADDRSVPPDQCLLMARALLSAGVRCSVHVLPEGRHGLGLARENPAVARWTALCEDWLKTVGFLPSE